MNKQHLGSDLDDALKQDGLLAECEAVALRRVSARPEWVEASKDPGIIALREDNAGELAHLIDSGKTRSNDAFHSRQTLLHGAAQAGALRCAKVLLDRGAEIEAYSERGDSPLVCAVGWRQTEMAAFLLSQGARLSYHYAPENDPAAQNRFEEQAQKLFKQMSPEIETTFDQLNKQINADLELKLGPDGLQNLEALVPMNPAELAKMVSSIAFQPRDIHAIHECLDLEMLKLLVGKHAAQINVIARDGEWPLKLFAREGNAAAVAYLLQNGATPDLTSTGETALHAAVQSGNAECVRLLLAAGANPNQLDVDMSVPLGSVQNDETLDLLLAAGADPNITDQAGFHPSQWIKDPKLKKRVESLESFHG